MRFTDCVFDSLLRCCHDNMMVMRGFGCIFLCFCRFVHKIDACDTMYYDANLLPRWFGGISPLHSPAPNF
jgi:hypothetical protein